MMKTEQNKVFQIELCKEDAERILNALELLRSKVLHFAQTTDPSYSKETPWLEFSYVSELLNDMECKLDIDQW
jgi:hypothetical protein